MPVYVSLRGAEIDSSIRAYMEWAGKRLLALLNREQVRTEHFNKFFSHIDCRALGFGVLICSDSVIRDLNKKWFRRDRPTNCISFGLGGQGEGATVYDTALLGDIAISIDTAKREAAEAGYSVKTRLLELLIHGFSHLMGHDHELGQKHERMQQDYENMLMNIIKKEGIMAELCVNVDHVATIRQARGGDEPDPVAAASIVEIAGADGIVVHLREDRRHIQDRDLRLLRQIVSTRLTLEMAATDEMLSIARDVRPDIVTLVPERREEITTEGGLDVLRQKEKIKEAIMTLNDAGMPVTLFVDPEGEQIEASKEAGAQCIEIHTGRYAEAKGEEAQDREFEAIVDSAALGAEIGLRIHVGHGLNYRNVARLTTIPEIEEYSIGHSIISRAVMVGLHQAVRDMISLIKRGYVT